MRGIVSFIVSKAGWLVGAAVEIAYFIFFVVRFVFLYSGPRDCWSRMQTISEDEERDCERKSIKYERTGFWKWTTEPYVNVYYRWMRRIALVSIILTMFVTKTNPIATIAYMGTRFAFWCWRHMPLCVIMWLADYWILAQHVLYHKVLRKFHEAFADKFGYEDSWEYKYDRDFCERLTKTKNKLEWAIKNAFTVLYLVLAFCQTRLFVALIFGV